MSSPVLLFRKAAVLAPLLGMYAWSAGAATLTFSSAGADPAAIQGAFDSFVAELGGVNNGTTAGSQGSGFRRITWDGGGAAANAAIFTSPMVAFANRGNVYTNPIGGFEISGQPTPEFGDINPGYPGIFQPFSSPRLFAPLTVNFMDVLLTVPGSTTDPATTRGFGVVFTDVDLEDATALEFYDVSNNLLGTYYAEAFDNGLSFLGVTFDTAVVSRVLIMTGTAGLGPDEGPSGDAFVDVVAMDDFVYGEPQAAASAIPEPLTVLLVGVGLAGIGILRRKRTA